MQSNYCYRAQENPLLQTDGTKEYRAYQCHLQYIRSELATIISLLSWPKILTTTSHHCITKRELLEMFKDWIAFQRILIFHTLLLESGDIS